VFSECAALSRILRACLLVQLL